MPGPLAGVRVLDLTRLYPGPYATLLLSDLGADVVKVEDPGQGDYLRDLPGMSGQFAALNRGKRSICLDLRAAGGPELLKRLCAASDVLVEGFRPGVLERLGCAPAQLISEIPRLVVCSISGYGQTGPLRERAGHDIGYLAAAGVLARSGLGETPVLPGVQLADFFGGAMQAVVAVLAALLERERTGRGRALDVAMCEGAMQLLLPVLGMLAGGAEPQRRGDDVLSGSRPCYRVYACADGAAVVLGALEPKFWQQFCAAAGRPEWEARQLDAGLSPEMDALFRTRTRAEWLGLFGRADCCLEEVLEPSELRNHPQHAARSLWLSGSRLPRTLPALVATEELSRRAAPALGEHTEEVLRERGFTEAEVAELRRTGVAR